MRLTPVLNLPPRFHFWKDFGAGKKRRIPFYKNWWTIWRRHIDRDPIADHTLTLDRLPPGSRIIDAEDLINGPIDAMPEELLKMKSENILYDHPWPFNLQQPVKLEPIRVLTINDRFFVPRDDSLVLTNTLLHCDDMPSLEVPGLELTDQHWETIQRQYDWATKGDSVLIRGPSKREFPYINRKPTRKYGPPKERQEINIISFMNEYSQAILAKHYHANGNKKRLAEILTRRSLAYPHCSAPYVRGSQKMNLQLNIELMSTASHPLDPINIDPSKTKLIEPMDISPRSWKSLMEVKTRYDSNWTFSMPRQTFPHTIQLSSRIKRTHRHDDEMLARALVHSFGLTSQYARFSYFQDELTSRNRDISNQATTVLQNPLDLEMAINEKELLDKPIMLQTIAFDHGMGQFHFVRFQLNTINFNDSDPKRIKNEAWYSGPITDLKEAFKYYLDFQDFGVNSAKRMIAIVGKNSNQLAEEKAVST